MGTECLKRKDLQVQRVTGPLVYACDQCRHVHAWPPYCTASIRTQQTWVFCSFECWKEWLRHPSPQMLYPENGEFLLLRGAGSP